MPAGVAKWAKPLFDYRGGNFGIFLQPFADVAFEGVEFTYPLAFHRTLCRCVQILADRFETDLQLTFDFADGPVLGPIEPVQVIDLIGRQHRLGSLCRRWSCGTRRLL